MVILGSTGARSQPRIRELKVVGDQNGNNQGMGIFAQPAPRIFKAEEYNPLRNPGHFSDAQHLERRGVHLDSANGELSHPQRGKICLSS